MTPTQWVDDTLTRQVGSGTAVLARMRERAAQLEALCHPAVVAPEAVGTLADGTVVVTMRRVDGDSLASVTAVRGGLSVGECVTLGMAMADALAAMHRVGLAHGDVSPHNIVLGRQRMWLVDTMAGACESERGTPGFAAPERPEGASAAGDVYALGKVLMDVANDAEWELLEPWVAPMLHGDPAVRPSAAMVARALAACAPPEPLELPAMGVATAMRSHVVPESARTLKGQAPPGWAVRRFLLRHGRKSLVSAALAMVAVGALMVWSRLSGDAAAVSEAASIGAMSGAETRELGDAFRPEMLPGRQTPAMAAVALTLDRYGAVAQGNAEELRATTMPGSTAWEEMKVLSDALEAGALEVYGLTVTSVHAQELVAGPRQARVQVRYALSPYLAVADGTATPHAAWEQELILELHRDGQKWRVWSSEAIR